MCRECDYRELMTGEGLDPTSNRLAVLEALGDSPRPVSASELLENLRPGHDMNRVTLYRILELLVEKRLVERISAGDRSFRYGLAPNDRHRPHPHFYCTRCGRMECLSPEGQPDLTGLKPKEAGAVHSIQIRLDGTCGRCLARAEDPEAQPNSPR